MAVDPATESLLAVGRQTRAMRESYLDAIASYEAGNIDRANVRLLQLAIDAKQLAAAATKIAAKLKSLPRKES